VSAQVNPHTLECLAAHGIETVGLRSKPWGEFFGLTRPPVRVLITFSEVYAAKADWDHDTATTVKTHWALPDPGDVSGSEIDVRLAFEEAFGTLAVCIRQFLTLPFGRLCDAELSRELGRIGEQH
jgi:arsenate reductase